MTAWIPHEKNLTWTMPKRRSLISTGRENIKKKMELLSVIIHMVLNLFSMKTGQLFDYIVKNTDPNYVSFEMDIMWVFFGGSRPG
jgi:hypothetical protein